VATKLSLYNSALFRIKQRKLASLSAGDPTRYALDDVYNETVAYMLEQGLWNFAQKTIAIEASVEIQTEFGFRNAFVQPDDFVRLISISANPYLWPPMVAGQFQYEVASDGTPVWQADCNPLFVSYVSNDAFYGGDLSRWTQTFADAVAWELAYRIAPPQTNQGDGDRGHLLKEKERALRNAKTKDSLNQSNMQPPPGQLVMARRNYRNRTLWER